MPGWVAYAVTAVVSAIGENKLMPLPDCDCKVISADSGYVRDNTSWLIGRIARDFDTWKNTLVTTKVNNLIQQKWTFDIDKAEKDAPGLGKTVEKTSQAGLCVSIYKAE